MGLIAIAALTLLQQVADSSQILVISGEDTSRFAVRDTIRLTVGAEVELLPVVYDRSGRLLSPDVLWWHNTSDGFIEFPNIDPNRASGTGNELVQAKFPFVDEIMLHGPNGLVTWVWFRVLPERRRPMILRGFY